MRRKVLILVTAILASSTLASSSQASGVVTGGACTKAGAITVNGTKTFICSKALSGKLVWTAPAVGTGAKPQISGGGPGGGPDDEGSPADIARHAAMKKYSDCLVAHGGTAMELGRPGPDGPNGGPNGKRPSQSAAQTKAMTACASLAPKFPKFGGHFPGPDSGGDGH